MSRWSDEFDSHAIHQLLDQADQYLGIEVEVTDAAFEGERRRLKNVLGNLRRVVSGLDQEFFPKQVLDEIYQHFNGNILNHLNAYSSQKSIDQLRVANDSATQYANRIYSLAAMSRPQESQEVITNAQKAFTSFMDSMELAKRKSEERFAEYQNELAAVSIKATGIEQAFNNIEKSANEKLAEWQSEYTEKQSARATEHSEAQIDRNAKFKEFLSDWNSKVENQHMEIGQKQDSKLQAQIDEFVKRMNTTLDDMRQKHEKVIEIHNLVGRDSIAGGYESSADKEQKQANRWRDYSMGCIGLTIVWLIVKYLTGFTIDSGGYVNWPEIITASSLTAILIYSAGYTSRQSKMHRENEKMLRSYALETKALDPFIASLEKEEQQAIKAELVRRMFGQQNATVQYKQVKLDEGSMRNIVDNISDAAAMLIEKRTNKG